MNRTTRCKFRYAQDPDRSRLLTLAGSALELGIEAVGMGTAAEVDVAASVDEAAADDEAA